METEGDTTRGAIASARASSPRGTRVIAPRDVVSREKTRGEEVDEAIGRIVARRIGMVQDPYW